LANPRSDDRSFFDRPYLLLTLVSLFWAINIVLGRYIAGTVPPVMLALARWGGAALILLPFVVGHIRRDRSAIRTHFKIMIVLSLTGMTLYNTFAYYGLQYTEAINGLLIQSAGPLFIGLISFALFRDRLTGGRPCFPLSRRQLVWTRALSSASPMGDCSLSGFRLLTSRFVGTISSRGRAAPPDNGSWNSPNASSGPANGICM
jgi:hypothetical protein